MKASDIFSKEEIEQIRYWCKMFNGKVTRILDAEENRLTKT